MNERIRVGRNKNTCPWHKINGTPKSTLRLDVYQGMRVGQRIAIDILSPDKQQSPSGRNVAGTQIYKMRARCFHPRGFSSTRVQTNKRRVHIYTVAMTEKKNPARC
jgi:hypothetical protein